jgi:hypothetical protein
MVDGMIAPRSRHQLRNSKVLTASNAGAELARGLFGTFPRIVSAVVIVIGIGVTIVTGLAVLKGQGVSVAGLKIEEYHPPEVQKCAFLASAIPSTSSINTASLDSTTKQILNLRSQIFEK